GWGTLAAALVMTSGALAWGSFGGMEIPLVAALAMGLVRAMQLGRERTALFCAALLPLARPEWAAVTAIVILIYAPRHRAGVALAALPLVGYFALNFTLTGRAATNGMLAKSLLHDPNLSLWNAAGVYWDQLMQLAQTELGKLRLVPLGAPLLAAIAAIRPSRTARLCA